MTTIPTTRQLNRTVRKRAIGFVEVKRMEESESERQKRLASEGKGYWIKNPCPQHEGKFNLECPKCNGKNSTFVEIASSPASPPDDELPETDEFDAPFPIIKEEPEE